MPLIDLTGKAQILLSPHFAPAVRHRMLSCLEPLLERFPDHTLVLSSGTTALVDQHKWIALSNSALEASARAVNGALEATSADRWLRCLPHYHVGGLGIEWRARLFNAQVVELGRWRADHFVDQCQTHQITLSACVPTQLYDLVACGQPCPPTLRALIVGGGALDPALYAASRALGYPVLPSFGMTETASQIATARAADLQTPSATQWGLPPLVLLDHIKARIREGFLEIHSPALFSASLSLRMDTGELQGPHFPELSEGYWRAPDRAQLEGRVLQIHGRTGDFLKIDGETVELLPLQNLLDSIRLKRALSNDVAIVPLDNARRGTELVLAHAGCPDLSNLIAEFNAGVLGFARIQRAIQVPVLPRTELGKLKMAQLKADLERRDDSPKFVR